MSPRLGGMPLVAALAIASVSALAEDAELGAAPRRSDPNAWNPQLDEYVVEPGDTLWGISERVVGSPWQWPRVWAYNPEITNPHWIYPGDIIRFQLPEVELPLSTTLIADHRELPPVEDIGAPPEDEGEKPAHLDEPHIEYVDTATRPAARARRFVGLFVTPQELAESGKLTNAIADKILLSVDDRVFLRFPADKRPKRGDALLVYRTVRAVEHPVTGGTFGYLTQVTAIAEVELNETAVTRARLTYTEAEVERGQLVTTMTADPRQELVRVPVKVPVEGVLVALNEMPSVVAGAQQIAFIDKGAEDGLAIGNELRVFTRGDRLTGEVDDLPWLDVGRLLIVDVKAKAATCLVTGSTQELEVGLKVQARP